MDMNIDSRQVVQVVLQYLQENGMGVSYSQLQIESGVSLNQKNCLLIESIEKGKWHLVLD